MKSKHTTRDTLLAKEGLATLLALALLALAAAVYPLEPVGSEAKTGQAAAPWLFLGLQELLRHLPAMIAGLLIPLAALLLYAALPWLGGGTASLTPRWGRAWRIWEYPAWLALLAWAGLTLYAALPGK
ncbi:hypothetical protein KJ781_04645 [Patescibacteria group bacterium]|nr:hypothetical protein [Patescibacteria group bacterium]